jgi:hypothetical protein
MVKLFGGDKYHRHFAKNCRRLLKVAALTERRTVTSRPIVRRRFVRSAAILVAFAGPAAVVTSSQSPTPLPVHNAVVAGDYAHNNMAAASRSHRRDCVEDPCRPPAPPKPDRPQPAIGQSQLATASPAPPPRPPAPPAAPLAYSCKSQPHAGNCNIIYNIVHTHGWDDVQAACAWWIVLKESGGNERARNPSSGAYGLGQALPASKMAVVAPDYLSNPWTQAKWMIDVYIPQRPKYRTPCGAQAFWAAHGWY